MHVIEVVARLGDSVVGLAHLDAGGCYRIGSAPGVDCGAPGFGTFPLVDRGLVRVPAGLDATLDGRRVEGAVGVRAGTFVIAVGLVTFTIAAIERAEQRVPRSRFDRRPLVFVAASLIAQLALLLAATTLAPYRQPPRVVPEVRRIARVHAHAKLPPPKAVPKPSPTPAPAPVAARSRATEVARWMSHGIVAADLGPSIARISGTHDLDAVAALEGPVYDGSEEASDFGSTRRRLDMTTVKVGAWAVPTYLRTSHDLAPVPALEWCDDDSCTTRGPLAIDDVRPLLERHADEIAQCYREHTADLVATVHVRFAIAVDGSVPTALGYGSGTVGRCIAAVARRIRWPQASGETAVFVGLVFRPAAVEH